MRPLRVFARNYCSWPEIAWDIPTGVTAIHGRNDSGEGIDSNGAGKSKLLDLLAITCWGPSLPWSEYVPVGDPTATVEVGLEFLHSGETYRVRRRYNPKGRGASETHFEILGLTEQGVRTTSWQPLTRGSQSETQNEIVRVLGLTEETFAHSVFSKQGARHFADPTLTPKERKEILAEALGLGRYDILLQAVRADAQTAHNEVAGAESQLRMLEEELDKQIGDGLMAPGEVEKIMAIREQEVTVASESVQEFRTLYDKAKAARDALRPAQERVEAAARTLRMAEQSVMKERDTKDWEADRAIQERDRLLTGAQGDREEALRLRAEADAIGVRAEALLSQAKSDPETCDRCGQPVKDEALKTLVAGLLADAAALDGKRRENLDRADSFDANALKDVEQASMIVVPDPDEPFIPSEEAASALAEAGNAQTKADLELEELEADLPSDDHLKTLAAQTVAAQTVEADAKRRLAEAQTALGRAQADLERRQQVEARHAQLTASTAELQAKSKVLQDLAQAYGRDGIPALIMESTAIPKIEREAERVLGRLGVPFRVELRTQAVLKTTSERLKDTLEVIVHEPAGERRYESFSGGEKARLGLGLRIGMARLLAHRSGASLEILILDEIEFLDEAGTRSLLGLLHELLPEFPSIVFVSHHPTMLELCDQFVTVEKHDGVSNLIAA